MRMVIIVGNGFTKPKGVGDRELSDVAGKEYEPYDKVKIAATAMHNIMATRPPGQKGKKAT